MPYHVQNLVRCLLDFISAGTLFCIIAFICFIINKISLKKEKRHG